MKMYASGLVAVVVLLCGCKTGTPTPAPSVAPTKGAVCSSVGKTDKDADNKTLMCYRDEGDLLPRWNEG